MLSFIKFTYDLVWIDSSCFPLKPYPQTWKVYEDQSSHGNASDDKPVCGSISLVYVNFLFTFGCSDKFVFTKFVLVIFSEQVVYTI